MKRHSTVIAATLGALLVILLTLEIQLLVPSFANPSPGPDLPTTPDPNEPLIRIISPEPGKLYNAKNVSYSITIEKPTSWIVNHTGYLNSVGYVLDGETNVTIPDTNDPDSISISVEEPGKLVFTQKPGFVDLNAGDQITIEGNLSGLAEGNHTIQVWVSSTSVYHPADTPQNFYGWWKAVAEVPLATSSGVVHFSVTNKAIDSENTPAIFASASITSLSMAVIGIGLFVHTKKRQRKADPI
jgi:hypothetical protein